MRGTEAIGDGLQIVAETAALFRVVGDALADLAAVARAAAQNAEGPLRLVEPSERRGPVAPR